MLRGVAPGGHLPIVFADARDCSALIAWSVVRAIKVTDTGTRYSIGDLWAVPPSRPQHLQRLKSDDHIAEGHIRPYVLCRTPAFLRREATRPRNWRPPTAVETEAREGRRRLATHMRLERSPALVRELKRKRMVDQDGRLPCDICGFDFLESYGPIGFGFAEAHHKTWLYTSPTEGRVTRLEDLAVVCSNCHSMLHHAPDYPGLESLRARVRHARQKVKLRR